MLGFYGLGCGMCDEMAFIEKDVLNHLKVDSRIVSLPGEDHAFVEVLINRTWMVSDSGYNYNLVTRNFRASERIKEHGAISLVYVKESDPPLFITDQYVNTDNIIIHVLKNGVPYANGKISLTHKFQGRNCGTPEMGLDNNGTFVIKFGNMTTYNEKAGKVEDFYWVVIDGSKTSLKVMSYGLNETREYTINIH